MEHFSMICFLLKKSTIAAWAEGYWAFLLTYGSGVNRVEKFVKYLRYENKTASDLPDNPL